ncbi:MAG: glycosyltransferase family 2 protein [Candidatus Ancillula sp.]|nr:glycosyltransferase family 2 protein [Candidatus Ancillula sp.]
MKQNKRKKITYILPTYNEEAGISVFFNQLSEVIGELKGKYDIEYLFINDGSTDKTLEILKNLKPKSSCESVRIINFSKNFGHESALAAGMDYIDSDAGIIMDTDLQDPPAVSLELIKGWEDGYDMVAARRSTRVDGFLKKFTAKAFYKVFSFMSDSRMPEDVGNFRLLDQKVIKAIRRYGEHSRMFRAMVADVGFKQKIVDFKRDGRYAGETHYPYSKMFSLAIDGIMGYSIKPLKMITKVGLVICLFDFILALVLLINKFVHFLPIPNTGLPGWTSEIIVIIFFAGLQIFILGIIGAYIGRIFTDVQNRPLYLVSDEINILNTNSNGK